MKIFLAAISVLIGLVSICPADIIKAADPLNYSIKKLYASPTEESKLVFAIPIDVNLLDISADRNWYKVRIHYALGPLNYTHIGWTRIPANELLPLTQDITAEAL
jgi:hypothetical protein